MDHKEEHSQCQSAQHRIRVEKVEKLAQAGISAWPAGRSVTATAQEALDHFIANQDEGHEVALAGRLMSMRAHGKTVFIHLQDRSGKIQLYIKQDLIAPSLFAVVADQLDLGDIIWAKGTLFTTKTGEVTVKVVDIALLSKCLHPLPEKFHGLTDVEQRYRQRYLDTMTCAVSREKFKMRSRVIQELRAQLLKNDFLEVETPMLHPIPGGAAARPFVTRHNAYDMELYLRIAPELYLKRLVIGGFDRVFEINRNFRNEGVSTRHNPEFTMLEFYMAHADFNTGMALTERLFHAVAHALHGHARIEYGAHRLDFESAFRRISMKQSLIDIGGLAPEAIEPGCINKTLIDNGIVGQEKKSLGEKHLFLFDKLVEHTLIQPTFITDYPVEISPLAKAHEHDPSITARFELFVAGIELANGFNELNDPFEQAERFKGQAQARTDGDDEAHYYDADFIKALEYGLPPTAGVGIGIDRLVMLMTNTTSIKDVILFPTMKRLA